MKELLPKHIHGCGAHWCVIEKPAGQGTNGDCMCEAKMLIKYIRWIKFNESKEETIKLAGRIVDSSDFWITFRARESGMIFDFEKSDIRN